jgi:hypothetical protein
MAGVPVPTGGDDQPEPRVARHRRGLKVAGLVLAVGLCVLVVLVVAAGTIAPGTSSRGSRPTPRLGPAGVVAPWVVAENSLRGTTAWQISRSARIGGIEGFADENYVTTGQRVGLYVSSTASHYRVVAYRMGYYQGRGAREVWSSGSLRGRVQPRCPTTPGINMTSCANWSRALRVTITSAFVQGDYLFKLTGNGGQQAYVPLTVWDPTSRATYLVMNRTFVEQGWNAFGGYDFYQGKGACAPGASVYPVCNRARVVSFDRPYDTGNGASDFFGDEYPLIRFCEEHGLDVTYVTDVTVTEHPGIVARHRVLLSLGHDESWSYQERVGVQQAEKKGLNIVFFGAASVLRHVRLQASPLGRDRQEVDYRDPAQDPLTARGGSPMQITGNTWSSPPSSWPGDPLVGETYSGYLLAGTAPAPFVVADARSWIYRGTHLHDGSVLPSVIASDIDHVAQFQGVPADLMVLGHSPIPLSEVYTNQGTWGASTYSDMTYYTDPHSGAGVIDTGNNNWINAMTACPSHGGCAAGELQLITGNILRLFGLGPAGRRMPSRSNLSSVRPAGS